MPDFYGLELASLQNSHLRVDYLTQAGPRIVGVYLAGSAENLLGEFPDIEWEVAGLTYRLLGGHRLWAAPEQPGVSYMPDDSEVHAVIGESALELIWEPQGEGLAKSLTIQLVKDGPILKLTHKITNRFEQARQFAPWGITVLPLGGRAYLPTATIGMGLQPDRRLVLWPYSHWDDVRLKLRAPGLEVEGEAGMPPLKVGAFVAAGACAYYRAGVLMMKRFEVPSGEYPDDNCNVEVYCADRYLELETLGPLATLSPGDATSINETWEFYTGQEAEDRLAALFS